MSLFLKFGVLFIRTVAKPVSGWVKQTVKDHETFRRAAVGGARLYAQTNARWDRLVRRRPIFDKKGNPIQRRELTEAEAIDVAGDIIGEGFLLYSPHYFPMNTDISSRAVATAGLAFQQSRSSRKEKEKEKIQEDKLKQLAARQRLGAKELHKLQRQYEDVLRMNENLRILISLKFRHLEGDWDDLTPHELFSREEIWDVMAEEDEKLGGRRELPKLKSDWNELLQKLKREEKVNRDIRVGLSFI